MVSTIEPVKNRVAPLLEPDTASQPAILDIPAGSVLLVASTQAEKAHDLRKIGAERGWHVKILPIVVLEEMCHSVEEIEKTCEGNAKLKLAAAYAALDHAFSPPNVNNTLYKLSRHGVNINPRPKIFIVTEDSGITVPDKVRDAMAAQLQERKEESYGRFIHPDHPFPNADYKPVMDETLGENRLFDEVRSAAHSAGYTDMADVEIRSKSVLAIAEWREGQSFAQAKVFPVEGNVSGKLLAQPAPTAYRTRSANDHIRRPESTLSWTQEDAKDQEYTKHHSARAAAMRNAEETHSVAKGEWKNPPPYRKFEVALLNEGAEVFPLFRHTSPGAGTLRNEFEENIGKIVKWKNGVGINLTPRVGPLHKLDDIHEKALVAADGIVLLPDGDTKGERLFDKLYALTAPIVAKQLERQSWDKSIVVLNSDGSWSAALDIIGEHMQSRMAGGRIGMLHVNDALDDREFIIEAKTISQAIQHFEKKRAKYIREYEGADNTKPMEAQLHGVKEKLKFSEGEFKGKESNKRFNVAIFCSASSENQTFNRMTRDLSYALAAHDFGVVYGAGDRYMMGAVLQGVEDYRSTHPDANPSIIGSSTRVLLGRETEKQTIPEGLTGFFYAKHIYQRMEEMIKRSDAFTIMPGGAGTLEEMAAVMVMRRAAETNRAYSQAINDPYTTKPKPIIICNAMLEGHDKGFWTSLINAYLGKKDLSSAILPKDMEKLKEHNLFVVQDEKEAMHVIESLAEERQHLINIAAKHKRASIRQI